MANLNTTVLTGSIAADPDLRWISDDNETGIVRLGLIVKKSSKVETAGPGEDEWTEVSSIFDVEVYGKFALTVARKLQKFDEVAVSGELVKDEWEDKDTGAKRSRIKIVARQLDSQGLFRAKSEDRDLSLGQQPSLPSTAPKEAPAQAAPVPTSVVTSTITAPAEAAETPALTADDIPF